MKKLLCFFPIILSLAASCEREVVMDAAGDEVVAVECVLTTEEVQHLSLTYTRGRSDGGAYREVEEAEALLYDLTEDREVGRFVHAGSGWVLGYSAVPGHEYSLEVTVPGGNVISAVTAMPVQCEIGVLQYRKWDDSSPFHGIKYIKEKAEAGKYPSFPPWEGGTVLLRPSLMNNTAWIFGEDISSPGIPLRDICTDSEDVDNFNLTSTPFVFEGNYSGMNGTPCNDRYLRFPKCSVQGQCETTDDGTPISALLKSDYRGSYNIFVACASFSEETKASGHGTLVVMTVSDDYDRYLKDSMVALKDKESGNLTSSYRRENVYSNIEGGTGIFGAKLEDSIEIFIKYVAK